MNIKNFAIFKVITNGEKKKNEKSPDYTLSVKVGDKYEEIGGGWIKEGAKGKFVSVQLSDERSWEYKGETITRGGWHLAKDEKKGEVVKVEVKNEDIGF